MRRRVYFLSVLSLLLVTSLGRAQFVGPINNDTQTPIPGSGHDYLKALSETVNPANGSLSIRISVPVPRGRGLSLPFSFAYDSGGVQAVQVNPGSAGTMVASWQISNPYGTALYSGGWSYTLPQVSASDLSFACADNPPNITWFPDFGGYTFTDPGGGRHDLYLAAAYSGQCTNWVYGEPLNVSSGGDDFVEAYKNGLGGPSPSRMPMARSITSPTLTKPTSVVPRGSRLPTGRRTATETR